jgi:hypothetical protein
MKGELRREEIAPINAAPIESTEDISRTTPDSKPSTIASLKHGSLFYYHAALLVTTRKY